MSGPDSRLDYIDWMRGFACVVMFQTHCYDSWLSPEARKSAFFMWSQLGGTLPAPLFLFLAGISFALVTEKLHSKGMPLSQLARTTIMRGAEIWALGILFRLQEFVIALGWAPWSDLLRVDILNIIGVSMMLMGVLCWLTLRLSGGSQKRRVYLVLAALGTALSISLLTPLMWTVWRPRGLPWPLESYINGVHNLGEPQAWLFPIFPWSGFAFAGLGFGFVLLAAWSRARTSKLITLGAAAGLVLIGVARWLDHSSWHLYSVYDYWHTSPDFFLTRVGLLLLILFLAFAWCRWGLGSWGFSPLMQMGQTSLLVYWVHIEFVYGRFSILQKKSQNIGSATFGLLVIFLSMLALSVVRTKFKRARLRFTLPSQERTQATRAT